MTTWRDRPLPDQNSGLERVLRLQAKSDGGPKPRKQLVLVNPGAAEHWAALSGTWQEYGRALLDRAILVAPDDFRFHVNLSNRLLKSGAVPEARHSLTRAALLEPGFGRVFANLGALALSMAEARALRARAWACGSSADVSSGIAMAESQLERGAVVQALETVSAVLALDPLLSEAWRIRAVAHQWLHDGRESRKSHGRAIIADPASMNGYIAASGHFIELRRFAEAHRLLGYAETITPGGAAVSMNRAAIMERSGDAAGALREAKRQAILRPSEGERYFTVGAIHLDSDLIGPALKYLSRARLVAPGDRRFLNNLAIAFLKAGRYADGFEAYEGRWFTPMEAPVGERTLWPRPSFDLPLWKPGRERRQRVLLWGEQGLGDEIWGMSYLTHLAGRNGEFAIEIDSRLVSLVARSFPGISPVPRHCDREFDISGYDSQLPLLSLPHVLRAGAEATPTGWLKADPERIADFRRRFTDNGRSRVIGLAWRSIKPLSHRSFELRVASFAPLRKLERTRFLPLQYWLSDADRRDLEAHLGPDRLLWPDFDVRDDLEALAAAVAAMDLVATAATALVPLANAVGTPSVVLLRESQRDWRYKVGSDISPVLPLSRFLRPSRAAGQELLAAVMRGFERSALS